MLSNGDAHEQHVAHRQKREHFGVPESFSCCLKYIVKMIEKPLDKEKREE